MLPFDRHQGFALKRISQYRHRRQNIATVRYWEACAPWYQLWIEHNNYHRTVLNVLSDIVRPGWRVLDIGGGNGRLAASLSKLGCRTLLLEPSRAMRDLFSLEAYRQDVDGVEVESRRWEDIPLSQIRGFDLILACNSLHVMSWSFRQALTKVFSVDARHVIVVAEEPYARGLNGWNLQGYELARSQRTDLSSSWVYHNRSQALDHAVFLKGTYFNSSETEVLFSNLIFENGHYWLKESARIHLNWWRNTDQGFLRKLIRRQSHES